MRAPGTIPFRRDNWLAQESYRPRTAYAMSKHAAEILGFELDRRLHARRSPVRSVVTHPGGAIDVLTPDRAGIHHRSPVVRLAATPAAALLGRVVQGKDTAARSAVLAVTATHLPHSAYLGPNRGATGEPALVDAVSSSRDP